MHNIEEYKKVLPTKADIRSISCVNHPLLSAITRREDFVARALSYGGKKWHRAMDYEIVRFTTDEDPQAVKKRCIAAIRALGHRLERCLEGNRMAKTFVEAMNMGEAGSGNGIDAFAPNSVLYSVGPVPRMLDHDDDPILCEFDGPDYQVKSNRCQIRFGYYAQTVPGEALLNMPQVSNA